MTTALADQEMTQGFGSRPAWQMPYSRQSWTRDNYALNSPYRFTDPTGWASWPVESDVITGNQWNPNAGLFGYSRTYGVDSGCPGCAKFHGGIDLLVPEGTPGIAPEAGVVRLANWQDIKNHEAGFGLRVVLEVNDNNGNTRYHVLGHMSGFAAGIFEDALLSEGDLMGYSGVTGNLSASQAKDYPHLHWEIRTGTYPGSSRDNLNPAEIFDLMDNLEYFTDSLVDPDGFELPNTLFQDGAPRIPYVH